MNADNLLDAFGEIDDRFLVPARKKRGTRCRRRLAVLAAAVLTMALCVGTAMAVSGPFRSFVFSIFHIEMSDQPPAAEATHPTDPGLHEIDVVHIDGQVNAWYFSSGGYVMVHDGGFYTSQWPINTAAPESPAFWEITFDGVLEVPCTRVDFPLAYGSKTFRICFDYAVLNGKLAVEVWPDGLDEDPVGNGWNAQPFSDSTNAVLLTIPVLTGNDWSHDLLLLDLTTLETTSLITDTIQNGVAADGYRPADDLRFVSVSGTELATGNHGFWLYDRQTRVMTSIESLTGRKPADVCFYDACTLIIRENQAQDRCSVFHWFIPDGTETILMENASPVYTGSNYCLLQGDDGTMELKDLRTGDVLRLTGLDPEKLVWDESPGGSRIMLAYEKENGFTRLGILDPENGVLKLLDRAVSGGSEAFRGWLDENTLVITAHDRPDAELSFTPGDGYYVYVYRFAEADATAPTDPAETEPAPTQPPDDADFVRVADYIPDIVGDLRYATDNNFTGQTIYDFTQPWLRYGTVKKLMQVQEAVKKDGMYLKIWDGFRPVSSQFRLWEVCPDPRYVADPNKGHSGHSRGNTVDITLVYADGTEVKMPTGYDDFTALADRDYSDCDPEAAANAEYLERIMEEYGFRPYSAEWWHYTDTQSYPVDETFQPTDN